MAELFDDYSPLRLQASGKFQNRAFTLIGRLQYKYREGTWNEWNALFDDGSTGTLSEDNGSYVFSLPATLSRAVPNADQLRVGATTAIDGKSFSVASNEDVSLIAAQGELPRLPPLGQVFPTVELRNASGEVFSIDYGVKPPALSTGKAVDLEALSLRGLSDSSEKTERARQFSCPNCGSPVEVKLENSKSITCPSCNTLIDLTSGVGGDLRHATQDEPVRPPIPLGKIGVLQGATWQVVGFQHRMGREPGDDDELFGWDEYLLFNRKKGFMFLVDSDEGWSVVKPATGAPQVGAGNQTATYLGQKYQLQYSYNAETSYVAGEFYWQVSQGQKTFNRDYAAGFLVMSMEQSQREVTWSVGNRMDGKTIAAAFKMNADTDLFARKDATPLASSSHSWVAIVFMALILFVVLASINRCTRCNPAVENCSSGYRSSGGSFGGFSTGGGHK